MEADKSKRQSYDHRRTSYIEGNTVRKLSTAPDIRREEVRRERYVPKKKENVNPKAFSGINFASFVVLAIAAIATVYVCVEYLMLQSDVTQMDKRIVKLESNLTSLTKENDAEDDYISATYDLDYVYKIAVEELGMVYPNHNKVITYKSEDRGYARQYTDVPN